MPRTEMASPVMAVEQFRREHGDVETWSTVDLEVYQNLLEIALAHGPIGGLGARAYRRTTAVAVIAYAAVLYAVTTLASAIRGPRTTWLDYHLAYVLVGPGRRADDRLRYGGDLLIRQRIIHAGARVRGEVDRLAARLHRH
ncbi:hypothetical protein ACH4E8_34320 [Streptomyces sp. NPDC017979]|uniref:hypothetical protein n=1 Tax=Streptomyces sp. NPDC017979 TaxID=3365024 RepID=UPI0037B477BA